MRIYSKIIVIYLSFLLLFGSSINYFTNNDLNTQFDNNSNNTFLTVSINKIDAVGINIISAVEILNILTNHNYNVISSFYLEKNFDSELNHLANPIESIFEFNRQIPELLIRKIIYPFHYFW